MGLARLLRKAFWCIRGKRARQRFLDEHRAEWMTDHTAEVCATLGLAMKEAETIYWVSDEPREVERCGRALGSR